MKECILCEKTVKTENLFGFEVCLNRKTQLKLFKEKTIEGFVANYESDKFKSFEEEMKYRLDFVEKDYIKKR